MIPESNQSGAENGSLIYYLTMDGSCNTVNIAYDGNNADAGTMGAVGTIMGMTKEAITPVVTTAKELGASVNDGWKCPSCGKTSITSLFCPDCGTKKPVENKGWNCPTCGKTGISSLFCPDCGTKKPVEKTTWDCECGEKNISSNFCPSCGHKRGE